MKQNVPNANKKKNGGIKNNMKSDDYKEGCQEGKRDGVWIALEKALDLSASVYDKNNIMSYGAKYVGDLIEKEIERQAE